MRPMPEPRTPRRATRDYGDVRGGPMTEIWAVIHRVQRGGGDVAVPSNRKDDPSEWERAHHGALRNMHACQREAQRWGQIADELAAEQHKAAAARWDTQGSDA